MAVPVVEPDVLKSPETKIQGETVIETDVEALIPDIYIEHDAERLDIYRRLYRCESLEDIHMIRAELKDRFGEYPEEVEHLFQQIELKVIAAKIGFIKVELSGELLSLHFPPPEEKEFYEGDEARFQKIMGYIHEMKQFQPRLKQDGKQLKLLAKIPSSEESKLRLSAINRFLEGLNSSLLLGEG